MGGEPNQAFPLFGLLVLPSIALCGNSGLQFCKALRQCEMDMPAIIRMHKTTLGSSRNRQARIPDRLDHTSEDLQSRPIAIRSKGFTFDSMTQTKMGKRAPIWVSSILERSSALKIRLMLQSRIDDPPRIGTKLAVRH